MKTKNNCSAVRKLDSIRQKLWIYWNAISEMLAESNLDNDVIDSIFSELIEQVKAVKEELGGEEHVKN